MALTNYVVASDLQGIFRDKDSGLPLAGGKLYFYKDSARTVGKEVFQLSGSFPSYTFVSMGTVITLSSIGAVQNSSGDSQVIYYRPYDDFDEPEFYYVVCKNSAGVEQFTRGTWPNITNSPTEDIDQQLIQENQISNPTFTNLLINDGFPNTYSVTAAVDEVFPLGPNWDFVISGTGSLTVERIDIPGNLLVPNSPPYSIDVTVSAGVTAALRQRFNVNSGLWSSTAAATLYLAGSFVAKSESGTTGVELYYLDPGNVPVSIISATVNSSYELFTGSTEFSIPQSTNATAGEDAYIDIYLSFIASSHVRITSINVYPTKNNALNLINTALNSSNRNEAYQGDYYIPRLAKKQVDSYLTGWDFTVNPFQMPVTASLAAVPFYIADQTMACRSAGSTITWAKDAVYPGIEFTAAASDQGFYILQYLEGAQVKEILSNRLSVNVFAHQNQGATAALMKVQLFRGTTGASIPLAPTALGTIAIDGTFALTAANWVEVPRSGLDTAKANIETLADAKDLDDGSFDYKFSQWEMTTGADITGSDKFAIVVTFACSGSGQKRFTVTSISLTPGDLPCRPAVKSAQETLKECQYYYERSYDTDFNISLSSTNGAISAPMYATFASSGPDYQFSSWARNISVRYQTTKRNATDPDALLKIYNLSGTGDRVSLYVYSGSVLKVNNQSINIAGIWTLELRGQNGFVLIPVDRESVLFTSSPIATTPAPTAQGVEAEVRFQFIADARLGIIT